MTAVLDLYGLGVDAGSRALLTDIDFSISPGERVGLIGESGSGKSLTALAALGLLPRGLQARGTVAMAGQHWQAGQPSDAAIAGLRGRQVGMVFQEPATALNPTMRVGDQVAEVMIIHRTQPNWRSARRRAVELLDSVGIPDPASAARAFPHQLSGGQRQRVVIAIALANRPALLICDEPTTALDVTVQAQVLDLIVKGADQHNAALLLITHDLAVVATVCDRVLVMADGRIVEQGSIQEVFTRPQHPHTRLLLDVSELSRPNRQSPGYTSGDAEVSGSDAPEDHASAVSANRLTRQFRRLRVSLTEPAPVVDALTGVSFEVAVGERFGIVGESGAGKSTLLKLMAGLDHPTSGDVSIHGVSMNAVPERERRILRRDLQVVFQDPAGSLDPRMRVADIIAEPLLGADRNERSERVAELLGQVGLSADAGRRFPHQFSGGQRQRIAIARALAPRPRILLADEPVSALDVSVRAQILDLIAELTNDLGLTLIFVSHDLSVVRYLCQRMAVMYRGSIVEIGGVERIWNDPQDPYTQRLVRAVPDLAQALAGAGTDSLLPD